MQRRDFGTWGIDLEPERFARALAAVGVVLGSPSQALERGIRFGPLNDGLITVVTSLPVGSRDVVLTALADALAEVLNELRAASVGPPGRPTQPLVWDLPRDTAQSRFFRANVAGAFADAWERAVLFQTEGPRIEIRAADWWAGASGPAWLVEQLNVAGARSAWVALDDSTARRVIPRWSWPPRIGLFDDPASRRLGERLERGLPWPELAEAVPLGAGAASCDLLIVPDGLTDALAMLLGRSTVRASCIVLLARLSEPWERARPLLAALRAHTRASGVAFAPVRAGDRGTWLIRLIGELAHDAGFDVALFDAARFVPTLPPLLFGDRRLIAGTELSQVAERIRRLRERPMAAALPPLPELVFDHESVGATDLARAARAMLPAVEAVAAPRFIQARIYDQTDPAEPRQLSRGLPANTPHRVEVWIGPPARDSISANVPFPDEELRLDETHRLTVVLTELDVGREPQIAEILLPPTSASTACEFFVQTGQPCERFAARIAVLHRNRVLQTALLRGQVVEPGPGPDDAAPLELTVEAVIRARIDDLAWRQPFDAAVIVNRTDGGRKLLTTVADQRVSLSDPADLDARTAAFQRFLESINANPEPFVDDPDAALGGLLLKLALHGSQLFAEVVQDQAGGALAAAKRLQIIAARAEAYLPLEFVYDREAPALDATLCPAAREALRTGSCPPGCLDGVEPERIVCPLGFWALSKIIERHVHDPDQEDRPEDGFAVLCEPTASVRQLIPTGAAVYAASNLVDGVDAGGIARVLGALHEATSGNVAHVETWAAWIAGIAQRQPTLLVVLPHLVRNDELLLPALEVSLSEQLLSAQLKGKHVRVADATRPIVLLLGCETGDPSLAYEKFPAAFRRQGAAIVLATLTKVIGRHAAPVAARLVTALATRSAQQEVTFGEVLLDLRRELLAEGNPMVLTLVAYGDAGWTIGAPRVP